MANVIVSTTINSGIVTIPGDFLEDLSPSNFMPSVYEGSAFNININFIVQLGEMEPPTTIASANNISNLSEYGVSITKTGTSSFNVSGSYFNVLEGGVYKFVMRDKTIRQLPADNSEDYRALVEFSMPSVRYKLLSSFYDIALNDGTNITVTTSNISQYVYWNFTSSKNTVKYLVGTRP